MTEKLSSSNQSWAIWQVVIFWGMWLLLLVPAYFAAHGIWLIGMPMFAGYHETVDIVLLLIMVGTLLLLAFIAMKSVWHFRHHAKSFWRLLVSLSIGVLGVPLLSMSGAVYAYISLAAH